MNIPSTVLAKFTCNAIIPSYGETVTAHFNAVYGNEDENKDFTKATPCGNLSISISKDVPASDFFVQGKNYYLSFMEVK